MKKITSNTRKLILARETVLTLQDGELARVQGGATVGTACTVSNCALGGNPCLPASTGTVPCSHNTI